VVTSPRAPFIKTGELQDGEIIVQERESRYNKNSQEKIVRKKIAGGSAEGPRHPGLSRPPPQGASKELFKKFSMPFAKESAPQKISRYIANSVRNKSAVWRNISQKHRKFSRTACRLNQRAGGNGLLKNSVREKVTAGCPRGCGETHSARWRQPRRWSPRRAARSAERGQGNARARDLRG
jgi:hypothetical protein